MTSNLVEQQKSRFHIIKINTGPCKRGRWFCTDTDEHAPSISGRTDVITVQNAGGSGSSSGRASYHGGGLQMLVDDAANNSPNLLLAPLHPGGENCVPTPTATSSHVDIATDALSTMTLPPVTATAAPLSAANPNKVAQHLLPTPQASSTPLPQSASVPVLSHKISVTLVPSAPPPTPSVPSVSTSTTAPTNQQTLPPLGVHPSSAFVPVMNSNHNNSGTPQLQQPPPTPSSFHSPNAFFGYPQPPGEVDLTGASVLLGKILPHQNLSVVSSTNDRVQSNTSFDSVTATAGNSSSVAIDNKIEQAMDLVKTHLLYAVREEVEILKVRIVELEKKVGNLEKENKILRDYAPPEVLAQLSSSQQTSNVLSSTASSASLAPQQQQQQQQQLQPAAAAADS